MVRTEPDCLGYVGPRHGIVVLSIVAGQLEPISLLHPGGHLGPFREGKDLARGLLVDVGHGGETATGAGLEAEGRHRGACKVGERQDGEGESHGCGTAVAKTNKNDAGCRLSLMRHSSSLPRNSLWADVL